MALELFAAIIAAVALGGIVHLLRRLTGSLLPKWSVTVAAGIGLIGTTIYLEYDWFNRVSAELPEGVEVVWYAEEIMTLRPWTLIAPITTKFVAMDRRQVVQHPNNDALRMAKLFNFGRWRPVTDALMVFDCTQGKQILVSEGVTIGEDGTLNGAEWVSAPEGDGFQAAACTAG
jgi:hypothetical protein